MSGNESIYGLILAGGQASRLGGQNKALIELGSVSLIERVKRRLAHQVDALLLSAPGPLLQDIPAIPDLNRNLKGPLAGLVASLAWAKERTQRPFFIATAAVDTPFFPENLVAMLKQAGAPAVAWTGAEMHPTFGLWPSARHQNILSYVESAERPSLRGLAFHIGAKKVDFADDRLFFNINTLADLRAAEGML